VRGLNSKKRVAAFAGASSAHIKSNFRPNCVPLVFLGTDQRFGIMRTIILTFLIWSATWGAAFAVGKRTYWPGFNGSISQFLVPLDAAKPKDRFLTLKIQLSAEPKANTAAFDSAFHAVCQTHRGNLLKSAQKISLHNDWRVKAVFLWPSRSTSSNGVTVNMNKHKFMWLSNCRATQKL
jgi:hypothetical protein